MFDARVMHWAARRNTNPAFFISHGIDPNLTCERITIMHLYNYLMRATNVGRLARLSFIPALQGANRFYFEKQCQQCCLLNIEASIATARLVVMR